MTKFEQMKNWTLDKLVIDRQDLLVEIARLKNGDCDGIVYSFDPNRERELHGQQRIAKMLNIRIGDVSKLESRIAEYCRASGIENPIPKGRTV